jgi:hypothetical protein
MVLEAKKVIDNGATQDSVLVGNPSIRTVIVSGQQTRRLSKTNLANVVS